MSHEKAEEDSYSVIFSSLRHPIRRKILRMLKDKPLTFSEILTALSIDSGHLSYHLESLGDLITRTTEEKYSLSSIGVAAVKLMGRVEEHSYELSKKNMKLSQIFAKAYPFVLSGALIVACIYFISFTTTVTMESNGVGWTFPNANVTLVNVTSTGMPETFYISRLPGNLTLTAMPEFNASVVTLDWGEATPINVMTSWQQQEKPYFYYGIAGLVIAAIYPIAILVRFAKPKLSKNQHSS